MYGPITYDLVSLLRDAYVEWDEERVLDWCIRYWEAARAAGRTLCAAGINPGFAMDVFGDGKTALKASYARYVAGQAIAFANQVNPIGALTASDTRTWTDTDGNGLPFDAAGNIQLNELGTSTTSSTFATSAFSR